MLHKGSSKMNFTILVPILIAALVICIVVLISRLEKPAEMTEAEGIAPIIVAEVTPAEPVAAISFPDVPEQADGPVPPQPDDDPNEIPASAGMTGGSAGMTGDSGGTTKEGSEQTKPEESNEDSAQEVITNERILDGVVAQTQADLDQRQTTLPEMRTMLALLEERGNDPERIALYKELIAKTEKEISDLEKSIARYQKASEE